MNAIKQTIKGLSLMVAFMYLGTVILIPLACGMANIRPNQQQLTYLIIYVAPGIIWAAYNMGKK